MNEINTYQVWCFCNNCNWQGYVEFPKGIKVVEYLKTYQCSCCGCKDTLGQPYSIVKPNPPLPVTVSPLPHTPDLDPDPYGQNPKWEVYIGKRDPNVTIMWNCQKLVPK